MLIVNTPIGNLDSDTSDFTLAAESVRTRLNMRVGFSNGSSLGTNVSINGNLEIISGLLPSGLNKVVGVASHEKMKKVYFFVWNENDYDSIFEFDYSSDTISLVAQNITQTNGEDIFQFDPDHRINHINIMDGDDYIDNQSALFSLTTGDDLIGTIAEILNTGDTLTEIDNTGGLTTSNVTLLFPNNQVRVTTNLNNASTITVNGETRHNLSPSVGTWEEIFVVAGIPTNISVGVTNVNDYPTPPEPPTTGTIQYSFDKLTSATCRLEVEDAVLTSTGSGSMDSFSGTLDFTVAAFGFGGVDTTRTLYVIKNGDIVLNRSEVGDIFDSIVIASTDNIVVVSSVEDPA